MRLPAGKGRAGKLHSPSLQQPPATHGNWSLPQSLHNWTSSRSAAGEVPSEADN